MSIDAYPLSWPAGRARTPPSHRARAQFGKTKTETRRWSDGHTSTSTTKQSLTVAVARQRLDAELERTGAARWTLSTNLLLNRDGTPRSAQRQPTDPGAAVYFEILGEEHVVACDRWDRVEDNIAALAKHVEATRGMERWGCGSLRQAFAGYRAALPAPGQTTGRPWWVVLGVEPDVDVQALHAAIKGARLRTHPDVTGSRAAWDEVEEAVRQARAVGRAV